MSSLKNRRRPLLLACCLFGVMGCKGLTNALQAAFTEPKVEFVQLHLTDLSLESVKLDFELSVDNPNPVGLSLDHLDYQLDVAQARFLSGASTDKVEVKANGTAPVRLPLTLAFADIANGIELLLSDTDTVPYGITFGLGFDTPVGPLTLPLSHQGEVGLPKLPELSVGDVRLARMDLRGARVEIDLGVKNRGQFPVKLSGLQYQVGLAGISISEGQTKVSNLAANAKETVVVPVELNFLKVGTAAVQALRSGKLPYEVQGELDLGLLQKPFSLAGTAKL